MSVYLLHLLSIYCICCLCAVCLSVHLLESGYVKPGLIDVTSVYPCLVRLLFAVTATSRFHLICQLHPPSRPSGQPPPPDGQPSHCHKSERTRTTRSRSRTGSKNQTPDWAEPGVTGQPGSPTKPTKPTKPTSLMWVGVTCVLACCTVQYHPKQGWRAVAVWARLDMSWFVLPCVRCASQPHHLSSCHLIADISLRLALT